MREYLKSAYQTLELYKDLGKVVVAKAIGVVGDWGDGKLAERVDLGSED